MSKHVPKPARHASAVEQADAAAVHALAPTRHTPVVKALGTLGELADQPQLFTITTATVALGLARGDRRLTRAGVRMVAAFVVATALKAGAKRLVDRTRPHLLVDEGRYAMKPGEQSAGPVNSFPSGHTAGALAVARAALREYPAAALPAYAGVAGVAAIQVPRCAHYPSDLAGGAVVGFVAEALVDAVARRIPVASAQPRREATAADIEIYSAATAGAGSR